MYAYSTHNSEGSCLALFEQIEDLFSQPPRKHGFGFSLSGNIALSRNDTVHRFASTTSESDGPAQHVIEANRRLHSPVSTFSVLGFLKDKCRVKMGRFAVTP